MVKPVSRDVTRRRIHARSRATLRGSHQTPRVNVYRSSLHTYAQIIDDAQGRTLVAASTMDPEVRKTIKTGGNIAAAETVGKVLASRAQGAGITKVVFDRGGYAYHGRIKALADAAREAGLKF